MLIVFHEWWGVNDDIRDLCARFAAEGIAAAAIDLYDGKATTDANEAFRMVEEMKTSVSMDKTSALVQRLASDPRFGKIGVTGFCLGGAMSIAAASTVDGISAAVPFYGVPRDEFAQLERAKVPILGHYAKEDPFVKRERVLEVQERAKKNGVDFEAHFYDAKHAFMRKGDPSAYDEASATLAWSRTIPFLRRHLA
ncbi:MAG: dienelactone hydrolase family protein [Polyangiaceae bacterium]|nr:dienelactone hydrolase family protein [Polyangiaceae bacterium]